ncbi:MAG: DinB family protein [Chloroflexi bacterium]|nr:DinB family protein [Chloroflexota bacterium]
MKKAFTSEQRQKKIQSYGHAYATLVRGLKKFPKAMWKFKPFEKDWSVHELIAHIADSEANSYIRCRRFIAEPGSAVLGYDGDKWASHLHYHAQSIADALQLFKWLRRRSYLLIKDLPDSVWTNTVNHSENGVMTMDDWLAIYEAHIPEHLVQMQGVYKAWKEKQRRAKSR